MDEEKLEQIISKVVMEVLATEQVIGQEEDALSGEQITDVVGKLEDELVDEKQLEEVVDRVIAEVIAAENTKVLPCTCKNDYQDEKYGEGKRLHNRAGGEGRKNPPGWRCTVCKDFKPSVKAKPQRTEEKAAGAVVKEAVDYENDEDEFVDSYVSLESRLNSRNLEEMAMRLAQEAHQYWTNHYQGPAFSWDVEGVVENFMEEIDADIEGFQKYLRTYLEDVVVLP